MGIIVNFVVLMFCVCADVGFLFFLVLSFIYYLNITHGGWRYIWSKNQSSPFFFSLLKSSSHNFACFSLRDLSFLPPLHLYSYIKILELI
jgi:hypothetical protein